jgi:hypothetical protein
MSNFKDKYFKYKQKYLNLKNQIGGIRITSSVVPASASSVPVVPTSASSASASSVPVVPTSASSASASSVVLSTEVLSTASASTEIVYVPRPLFLLSNFNYSENVPSDRINGVSFSTRINQDATFITYILNILMNSQAMNRASVEQREIIQFIDAHLVIMIDFANIYGIMMNRLGRDKQFSTLTIDEHHSIIDAINRFLVGQVNRRNICIIIAKPITHDININYCLNRLIGVHRTDLSNFNRYIKIFNTNLWNITNNQPIAASSSCDDFVFWLIIIGIYNIKGINRNSFIILSNDKQKLCEIDAIGNYPNKHFFSDIIGRIENGQVNGININDIRISIKEIRLSIDNSRSIEFTSQTDINYLNIIYDKFIASNYPSMEIIQLCTRYTDLKNKPYWKAKTIINNIIRNHQSLSPDFRLSLLEDGSESSHGLACLAYIEFIQTALYGSEKVLTPGQIITIITS